MTDDELREKIKQELTDNYTRYSGAGMYYTLFEDELEYKIENLVEVYKQCLRDELENVH